MRNPRRAPPESSLLVSIILDLQERGTNEPVVLSARAYTALDAGVAIANALGDLEEEVEQLALFCYHLEGRGDSPTTAAEIRRRLAAHDSVGPVLRLLGQSSPEDELQKLGKRVARRLGPDQRHQRTVAHLSPRAVIIA